MIGSNRIKLSMSDKILKGIALLLTLFWIFCLLQSLVEWKFVLSRIGLRCSVNSFCRVLVCAVR